MIGGWTWALIAALAVTLAAVVVWAVRRRPREDIVQSQLTSLAQQLDQLLQRQERTLSEGLTAVQGVVGDVRERLGGLAETGRRLTELAKDLVSLQEILRAPKARGAVGEWLLGGLLGEVLPRDRFREQHRFSTGEIVDAAVFLEGMIVPVDAKFPLSSFERLIAATTDEERRKHKRALVRDAQKHVDAIAQKYIRPEEGTSDFALMYIPAEGVYHELLTPDEDQ
ncbi:MAG: DNA recombination protein RmuC, partial [Candidatus Bipolaricaulota bacterium]